MSIRARFINADGVSFFENISEHCEVWRRFEKIADDWSDAFGVMVSTRIEIYEGETWYVPCGPLACPLDFDERGGGYDRVYRFKRMQ